MTDMSKFKVADAFKHLDPNQGLADGIATGFSSIRYKGKSWNLSHGGKTYPFKREDDGSPLTYVDLIILGISQGLSKVYFGDWNEDNATGPICASLKGDVPDPGVSVPQSKSCGICSHNEWITKPGGGRGKECQDHKRMAVLLMPAMTKKMLGGSPLLEPVHLKIPPGSLKSLKLFSDNLQSQGIPFASVVTRVSFSQDRLFEMKFEIIQALTNAEAPLVLPMMEDNLTRTIMGSMPEIKQIAPKQPEKVETGLLSAFGANGNGSEVEPPAKVRKARTAKAPVDIDDPPLQMAKTPEQHQQEAEPWEESDSDLDDSVAKLLSDKTSNMLK